MVEGGRDLFSFLIQHGSEAEGHSFPHHLILIFTACKADLGITVVVENLVAILRSLILFVDNAVINAESLEVLLMALAALHETAKSLGRQVSWISSLCFESSVWKCQLARLAVHSCSKYLAHLCLMRGNHLFVDLKSAEK